jgi:hypothetical protein
MNLLLSYLSVLLLILLSVITTNTADAVKKLTHSPTLPPLPNFSWSRCVEFKSGASQKHPLSKSFKFPKETSASGMVRVTLSKCTGGGNTRKNVMINSAIQVQDQQLCTLAFDGKSTVSCTAQVPHDPSTWLLNVWKNQSEHNLKTAVNVTVVAI